MAAIAIDKGDEDDALNFLKESLKISREIGNLSGESTALNNIAQIYVDNKNDYETALFYLEQSLTLSLQTINVVSLGTIYFNIGIIYLNQKKDIEDVIKSFWNSYKVNQDNKALEYLEAIKERIGELKYQEILSKL